MDGTKILGNFERDIYYDYSGWIWNEPKKFINFNYVKSKKLT